MVDTSENKQERLIALQAKLTENITPEQKAAIDQQIIGIMGENVSDKTKALLTDRNVTAAEKARAGVELLREVQQLMRRKYSI